MSTGAFPPPVPLGNDDLGNDLGDEPMREGADGDEMLDEDANDDLIDSAAADRIAAEDSDYDDEDDDEDDDEEDDDGEYRYDDE